MGHERIGLRSDLAIDINNLFAQGFDCFMGHSFFELVESISLSVVLSTLEAMVVIAALTWLIQN